MPPNDVSGTRPDLSILVVTYNCPEELVECIASLHDGGGQGLDWELLVCENGSERVEEMRSLAVAKGFRLVEPGANLGFGKANNILAREARGGHLLILNPDTIVPKGACRSLVDRLDDPGCLVSAPVLANADGSFQFSWNVPMGLAWEFCEVHYLQNVWRRHWIRKMRRDRPEGPWEVGFSSGACLCMRTSTFLEQGGFDEDFFLNHEDIELCDRIRRHGRILVFPEIVVKHLDGGTQRKNWTRFVRDRLEAKWVYLGKRYSGVVGFLAKAMWFEGVLLRIALSWLAGGREGASRRAGYVAALKSVLIGRRP